MHVYTRTLDEPMRETDRVNVDIYVDQVAMVWFGFADDDEEKSTKAGEHVL